MTKVALRGPVNGTGSLTLSAPETASDLTFELPQVGTHLASAQADGMPLGPGGDPVAATGSNSDGMWTKWADGTMQCRHIVTGQASGAAVWTFPSAFSEAPYISGMAGAPIAARVVTRGNVATTTTEFFVRDLAGNQQANVTDLLAIGRWK